MTERDRADAALRKVPRLYPTDRAAILDAIEAAGLVILSAEPTAACQTQRRETRPTHGQTFDKDGELVSPYRLETRRTGPSDTWGPEAIAELGEAGPP